MWACDWNKLPYEFVNMMPGKDTKKAPFVDQNWISTVPRIEDGDFVLNESSAILVYLARTRGWALYPSDPKQQAKVDEYLHWHHRNLRELTISLFAPAMRPDLKIPPILIAASKRTAKDSLSALEKRLHSSPYLCGPNPTIADIVAFCEIGQCLPQLFHLADLSPYPSVSKWVALCQTLPGYESSHKQILGLAHKIWGVAGERWWWSFVQSQGSDSEGWGDAASEAVRRCG